MIKVFGKTLEKFNITQKQTLFMRFSLFIKLGYLAIFLIILILVSFFVYENFYNTDTAKVERFVHKYLKKEFRPDRIELEWKLSIANQTGTDNNTYGMFWTKSNNFYVGIDYNEETEEKNKISSFLLGIFFLRFDFIFLI